MTNPSIETVFLDAGGVLVNPNWTLVARALTRHGAPVDAADLAHAEPRAKRAADTPEYVAATGDATRGRKYLESVLEGAGLTLGPATDAALVEIRDYHARENLWETVPEDVPPSLQRMRDAGLRLAVVSNSNGRLNFLLQRLGLASYFEVTIDSFDVGVEKPDPRIFQIAIERMGGRVETTLHVGDLYEVDVVGARAASLQAALVDVAGLYDGHDCRRFASLTALADWVAPGGASRAR